MYVCLKHDWSSNRLRLKIFFFFFLEHREKCLILSSNNKDACISVSSYSWASCPSHRHGWLQMPSQFELLVDETAMSHFSSLTDVHRPRSVVHKAKEMVFQWAIYLSHIICHIWTIPCLWWHSDVCVLQHKRCRVSCQSQKGIQWLTF